MNLIINKERNLLDPQLGSKLLQLK